MRKLLGSLVLCLGLSLLANLAHAGSSKFYYGVGFSDGSIRVDGTDRASLGTITGTLGIGFQEYLGLEVELGAASDDAQSIFSDSQLAYAAAMLRVGMRYGRVGIYGLFGQAFLDSASTYGLAETGDALGIGLNLFGNSTTSLNVHFLRLDDGSFTSTTIGFQHYLGGMR